MEPSCGGRATRGILEYVNDLQKRGSYAPRRVREQRLYRYAIGGFVTGVIGIVGLILAVVGVIGATLPILALLVAAACAFMARRVVAG
jgi:hypothetical protein